MIALQEKEQKSWLDEIQILQRCKHINVIRYKECFISGKTLDCAEPTGLTYAHIVMEFADEGDLDQHIKHQRDVIKQPFQESLVRNWLGKQSILLI